MTFLKSVIKSISPIRPDKRHQRNGGGEVVWVRTEILDAAASLEGGKGGDRRRRKRGSAARAHGGDGEGGGDGDGRDDSSWEWARARLTHKSRQLATERGVEVERYLRITVLPPPPPHHHHESSAAAGYDLAHVGRRVEIPATPDAGDFLVPANPRDCDDGGGEGPGPFFDLDLADLPHVHEPGVVSELARRFFLSNSDSDHDSYDPAPPGSPPQVVRGRRIPPPGDAAGGATYALAGPGVLLSIRPLPATVGGAAPIVVPRLDPDDDWDGDATLGRYVEFGADVIAGRVRRGGGPGGEGGPGEPEPPAHVYSVALGAYRSMCEDFAGGGGRADRAILVTGEGGSGRTTANRLAVSYLAALSTELRGGRSSTSSGTHVVSSPGNGNNKGGGVGVGAGTTLRSSRSEYLDGTSPRSAATLNLMQNYGDGDDEVGGRGNSPSSSSASAGAAHTLEQKVLHAGAILESFGSARVGPDRPDSTRLASCLRLRFGTDDGRRGHTPRDDGRGGGGGGGDGDCRHLLLSGASLEAGLLETSRLVDRGRCGGRNFHVFHQVLAGLAGTWAGTSWGASDGAEAAEERTRLAERCWLQDAGADDFEITFGGGDGNVGGMGEDGGASAMPDGSSDLDGYRRLRRAMTVVGFPQSEQEGIISVICALLHFSNVTAVDHSSAGGGGVGGALEDAASELDYDNPSLPAALDLLGVTADDLNHVLCSRCVAAGNETHFRSVSTGEADRTVRGIVRAAYGALLELLVHSINASVGGGGSGDASIVLMDCYGFEDRCCDGVDGANSFEQLCANYCHEAWMHTCNHLALVADQEEYRDEEIGWSSIDVPDNQDVLDLMDKKGGLGVLSILDEHCKAPGSSDALFVEDLYTRCSDHPRFGAGAATPHARGPEAEFGRFTVHHHAGVVEYDVAAFVEKNNGVGGGMTSPPREANHHFVTSSNALVRRLGNIMMTSGAAAAADRSSSSPGGPTTGARFAMQLRRMRMTIGRCASRPHFIRCIRPDRSGPCRSFDYAVVANQVRCAGVVEGIELSRTGLPRRLTHSDFAARYRDLVAGSRTDFEGEGEELSSSLKRCDHLVSSPPFSDMSRDGIVRVGRRSGVFLTEEAHERLELLLAENRDRRENFGKFHALCRGHLARQEFFISLYCAVMLQSNVRRLIGANRARSLREARARKDDRVMSSDEVLSLLDRGRLSKNRLLAFITVEVSSLTKSIHSNLSTTKNEAICGNGSNGVDANAQLSVDENLVHLSPNDVRTKGTKGGLLGQVVMELTSLRGLVRPGTDGTPQLVGQGGSIEPRGKTLNGGKTGASSRQYCGTIVDPDDAASSAVRELHALRQEIERLTHDAGRAKRDERRAFRDLATLRAAMKEMLALKEEGEALRNALRSKGA